MMDTVFLLPLYGGDGGEHHSQTARLSNRFARIRIYVANFLTDFTSCHFPPLSLILPRMTDAAAHALSDTVHAQMLELLASSAFPAGERLPGENALARRFSVSRPILRQALARLRAEGRIETRKGSGTVALGVPAQPVESGLEFGPLGSISDVRAFLEFRCDVEGEMAARAAALRNPETITALRQALAQLETDMVAGRSTVEADLGFHLLVARASGNRFYGATLWALAEQMRFSIRLTGELAVQPPAQRLARVREEHTAIVNAIEAGDAAAAREAIRIHLQGGITRLFG
jgi:GntR family transcriptional repressor for pyruvate dehydrogenase complex